MSLTKEENDQMLSLWQQMKTAYEDEHKEVVKYREALGETTAVIARMEQKMQQWEVEKQKPPTTGPGDEQKEQANRRMKTFMKACLNGYTTLSEKERELVPIMSQAEVPPMPPGFEIKGLYLGNDTGGGFLAPAEWVAQMIEYIVLTSPIRPNVSVRQTAARSVRFPKRITNLTAQWVGERTTRTETQGWAIGEVEIPTNEMYALALVSYDDLEDAAYDLEADIRNQMAVQFGVAENRAFLAGDGVIQPMGLLTNPLSTQIDKSGVNGQPTADSLTACSFNLLEPYVPNAKWFLKRTTIGSVRTLKDAYGQYLWQPGLTSLNPALLLDSPVVQVPDMPATGTTGAYIAAYGDFAKAYQVVDRIQIVFKRIEERYVENNQIGIFARRRVGGQVVLPEAFRIYSATT